MAHVEKLIRPQLNGDNASDSWLCGPALARKKQLSLTQYLLLFVRFSDLQARKEYKGGV